GGVVGERDEPARHVELAGRQREGVDRGRIEDGDTIVHIRPLRRRHELRDHLVEQAFELGILIGAVIGGQDAVVLARGRDRRRLWVVLGRGGGAVEGSGGGADREQRRAAAGERQSEGGEERRAPAGTDAPPAAPPR